MTTHIGIRKEITELKSAQQRIEENLAKLSDIVSELGNVNARRKGKDEEMERRWTDWVLKNEEWHNQCDERDKKLDRLHAQLDKELARGVAEDIKLGRRIDALNHALMMHTDLAIQLGEKLIDKKILD